MDQYSPKCFFMTLVNFSLQELEESRASWNVVKAKTAESEEQWVKLKADFAERKRWARTNCVAQLSNNAQLFPGYWPLLQKVGFQTWRHQLPRTKKPKEKLKP